MGFKKVAIEICTVAILATGVSVAAVLYLANGNDQEGYVMQSEEEGEETEKSIEKKTGSEQEGEKRGEGITEQFSQEELEERIETACGGEVEKSSYEDFDGDGVKELFALVMEEQRDGELFKAELWFTNGQITSKLNTWQDIYREVTVNDVNAENKKFYYLNMVNGEGIDTSICAVYGYEDGECFEAYEGYGEWGNKDEETYYTDIQFWPTDCASYCVDHKVFYEDRKYHYYASVPISHAIFEEYRNSRQEYEKALKEIGKLKNENTDYSKLPYIVETEVLYNSDNKILINFQAWKNQELYDSSGYFGEMGELNGELVYAEFAIVGSDLVFHKVQEGNWKSEMLGLEPYYSPESLKMLERMENEPPQLSGEQFEQIIQEIKTKYYAYQDLLANGKIEEKTENGYKAYYDSGLLRCIEINGEENGVTYNRLYYIMDNELYFAFFFTNNEPSIENRLYFYQGKMIRWIDGDGTVHDKEYETDEFKEMEQFAGEVDEFIK